MGGCKCTYRDCKVKSDGQTHMFHYPVFDKVRCHQWLTNAQRLDFLNLKVSQLKNRVVCQHHFRPEVFMNFKMDKLQFDAVPTENGPFCDTSACPQNEHTDVPENILGTLGIAPEDIENDPLSLNEKKANFSVKYGDFLINSEMDSSLLTNSILNKEEKIKFENKGNTINVTPNVSLPPDVKKEQCQPMLAVPPYFNNNNTTLQHEYQNTLLPKINEENNENQMALSNIVKPTNNANNSRRKGNNTIKIISEKKILTPFSVKGKLEPVSPSLVLYPRDPKKGITSTPNSVNNLENIEVIIYNPENNPSNQFNQEQFVYECPVIEPQIIKTSQPPLAFSSINNSCESNNINPSSQNTCVSSQSNYVVNVATPYQVPIENNIDLSSITSDKNISTNNISKINRSSPRFSLLKTKIPPARVAAIEEKRNFNKKLRDMIEFCLDDSDKVTNSKTEHSGLEKKVKEMEPNKSLKNTKRKKPIIVSSLLNADATRNNLNIKNDQDSQIVASHLSKEPKLPILGEYNMASIESRMKMMEDLLLRKIEQNSQRIIDLRNTIVSTSVEKKSITTQTGPENEDSRKKQLFQEISQYLSPDANSLLYEELFLKKFAKNSEKYSVESSIPSKRRRRR